MKVHRGEEKKNFANREYRNSRSTSWKKKSKKVSKKVEKPDDKMKLGEAREKRPKAIGVPREKIAMTKGEVYRIWKRRGQGRMGKGGILGKGRVQRGARESISGKRGKKGEGSSDPTCRQRRKLETGQWAKKKLCERGGHRELGEPQEARAEQRKLKKPSKPGGGGWKLRGVKKECTKS